MNPDGNIPELIEKVAISESSHQFSDEIFNNTLQLLSFIALADEDLSSEEFKILTDLKGKLGFMDDSLDELRESDKKLEILKMMESIISKMNQGDAGEFQSTFQQTAQILKKITTADQKKVILKLAMDMTNADGKIHPNETKLTNILTKMWT